MSSFIPRPFGLANTSNPLQGGTLSRTPASSPGIVGTDGEWIRPQAPPQKQTSSTAAQTAPPPDNTAEKRVIAVIHARNPTFGAGGQGYRLILADDWSEEYEAGYDVVELREARQILTHAAAAKTASKPEQASFEEASKLLADPNSRRLDSGLLLLRVRQRRYTEARKEEAVTPSQLARLMEKKEDVIHWIEIELVLPDGKSVANEKYLIVTPDDRHISGVTDSKGRARVDGIVAEGACTISFPDLYDDEWRLA